MQPLLPAEHDVAAVGERTLGERLEGAAPHDDGVPGGECLEALEVGRQAVQQFVVEADGAVLGHGHDDGEVVERVHTDTLPLMCGWGL